MTLSNTPARNQKLWQALGLAWQLGYTIAVPIVIFALAGRLLDKWLQTSPWLLLLGVFISIIITTWLIYRKTKDIVTTGVSAISGGDDRSGDNHNYNPR